VTAVDFDAEPDHHRLSIEHKRTKGLGYWDKIGGSVFFFLEPFWPLKCRPVVRKDKSPSHLARLRVATRKFWCALAIRSQPIAMDLLAAHTNCSCQKPLNMLILNLGQVREKRSAKASLFTTVITPTTLAAGSIDRFLRKSRCFRSGASDGSR
jgi:hypothetical protein